MSPHISAFTRTIYISTVYRIVLLLLTPIHRSPSLKPFSSSPSAEGSHTWQARLSWPGSSPEPQVTPLQCLSPCSCPRGVLTLLSNCSQTPLACPGTVAPSLRNRGQPDPDSRQVEVGGESRQEWPRASWQSPASQLP
jgi:hypothetical protein